MEWRKGRKEEKIGEKVGRKNWKEGGKKEKWRKGRKD